MRYLRRILGDLREMCGPAALAVLGCLGLTAVAAWLMQRGEPASVAHRSLLGEPPLYEQPITGMAWLEGADAGLLAIRAGASPVLLARDRQTVIDALGSENARLPEPVGPNAAFAERGRARLPGVMRAHATQIAPQAGMHALDYGMGTRFIAGQPFAVTADGGLVVRGDTLGLSRDPAEIVTIDAIRTMLPSIVQGDPPRNSVTAILPITLSQSDASVDVRARTRAGVARMQADITVLTAFARSPHIAVGNAAGGVAIHDLPSQPGGWTTPAIEGSAGATIAKIATVADFPAQSFAPSIATLDIEGQVSVGWASAGGIRFVEIRYQGLAKGQTVGVKDIRLSRNGRMLAVLTTGGQVYAGRVDAFADDAGRLEAATRGARADGVAVEETYWRAVFHPGPRGSLSRQNVDILNALPPTELSPVVEKFFVEVERSAVASGAATAILNDQDLTSAELNKVIEAASKTENASRFGFLLSPLPLQRIEVGSQACPAEASSIEFSADETQFYIGRSDGYVTSNTVPEFERLLLVQPATPSQSHIAFPGHAEAVTRLLLSPDGSELASLDAAGVIRITKTAAIARSLPAALVAASAPICVAALRPELRRSAIIVPSREPVADSTRADDSPPVASPPQQATADPRALRRIVLFPQMTATPENNERLARIQALLGGPSSSLAQQDERSAFVLQQVEIMTAAIAADEIRYCNAANRSDAERLRDVLAAGNLGSFAPISIAGLKACAKAQSNTLEIWLKGDAPTAR